MIRTAVAAAALCVAACAPQDVSFSECTAAEDADRDHIHNDREGTVDTDADGTPDYLDLDSDDDGVSDLEESGVPLCWIAPVDSDGDGLPDYVDLDSNADGIPDAMQRSGDHDGDGIGDRIDPDDDNDTILNQIEAGPDTDGDGTPDVLDDDSDNDTILDRDEGASDADGDGIANFRDVDSDGDGALDVAEAGDDLPDTPPGSCPQEIDASMVSAGSAAPLLSDGLADFVDTDSDNDGLGDAEERANGTDVCGVDTNHDGLGDLVASAYQELNCHAGTEPSCHCATSTTPCTIPEGDFFVVLPYEGPAQSDDLDFATDIHRAEIFLLSDATGSMQPVLDQVTTTIAEPGTGLIDRMRGLITDVRFGGGVYRDFPMPPVGTDTDQAFALLADDAGVPVRMLDAADAPRIQAAFRAVQASGGGDGEASATEAIYQTLTGEGGSFVSEVDPTLPTYVLPRYVADCLDGTWGAPCFRQDVLPVIIHFFDYCAHNGPPGESPICTPYNAAILAPQPAQWDQMVAVARNRGARYIGVNTSGESCIATGARGTLPCYFMRRAAEDTGSVDASGTPLVYDLPSESTRELFTQTLVDAVQALVTRVPMDLDLVRRDDPSDSEGVDATLFVHDGRPACRADPPSDPCFWPTAGVAPGDAVEAMDRGTFYRVLPGTRVAFRLTFENDFLPGSDHARVFAAYVDVRGDRSIVLSTREVFVVVPAASGPIF